jgi:hypothetical protein
MKIQFKNIFSIVVLTILIMMLVGCQPIRENKIREEINKANYCNTKDDCVLLDSKCPFGCYIYSNYNEAGRIKTLLDNYESNCVYGCISCTDVKCEDNKCIEVCEE